MRMIDGKMQKQFRPVHFLRARRCCSRMSISYLLTNAHMGLNGGRFKGSRSPGEIEREAGRRATWTAFGLTPPEWEDESNAPPVDVAAVRALVRNELPRPEEMTVHRLTLQYRSWADALLRIGAEEFRKGNS